MTNPAPLGPFGRPPMTSAVQRVYKPATGAGIDGYGPAHAGPANIAPAGRGLHVVEYAKLAGQSLRLAFPVDASNKLADFFKLPKETNGTTQVAMNVIVTSDFDGRNIVDRYEGADTVTDAQHAWYVHEGNPHNARTHALKTQLYYYWIDTPDGSAAKIPVGHSGSN